jgi:DNA-binding MarR family transcriptional regulator
MKKQRLENLLGALALSITDAIASNIEKVEGTYGSDTFALVLIQHAAALRSDVLSRQLGLAQSSTVRLVDRMERQGLVQREVGTDRRTVLVSLTASGEQAAERVLSLRQDKLRELVGELSEDEQAALQGLSVKLLSHLTVDLESGEHNCRLCDEDACGLAECPVELRYQTFEGALLPPKNRERSNARKYER